MKFDWDDQKIVSPQALQKMKDEMKDESIDNGKSGDDFCRAKIQELNHRIEACTVEGKKKIFPNYSLPTFSIFEKRDGLEVSYQNAARVISDNDREVLLTLMEAYVDLVEDEHERLMVLYHDYDKNLEKFRPLRQRVLNLGGRMDLERPFFSIRLPVVDSLESTTYQISGSEYYLITLGQQLDKLEKVIQELAAQKLNKLQET